MVMGSVMCKQVYNFVLFEEYKTGKAGQDITCNNVIFCFGRVDSGGGGGGGEGLPICEQLVQKANTAPMCFNLKQVFLIMEACIEGSNIQQEFIFSSGSYFKLN